MDELEQALAAAAARPSSSVDVEALVGRARRRAMITTGLLIGVVAVAGLGTWSAAARDDDVRLAPGVLGPVESATAAAPPPDPGPLGAYAADRCAGSALGRARERGATEVLAAYATTPAQLAAWDRARGVPGVPGQYPASDAPWAICFFAVDPVPVPHPPGGTAVHNRMQLVVDELGIPRRESFGTSTPDYDVPPDAIAVDPAVAVTSSPQPRPTVSQGDRETCAAGVQQLLAVEAAAQQAAAVGPERLATQRVYDAATVLVPAPPGLEPQLSATVAADAADLLDGAPDEVRFALLTDEGGSAGRPVWYVVRHCTTAFSSGGPRGPLGGPPASESLGDTWTAIEDASGLSLFLRQIGTAVQRVP